MIRIGIDLGGTKIEGIALSETGEELFRNRVATPQGDYRATLQTVSDLVTQLEKAVGEKGSIGVCTPGALSPASGLMRNSNSVCMNGKPVLSDLQQLLHRDIRIANDANCFALSEATDGAAIDAAVVFGVIVGTGTGAGVVIDNKVLLGPNAIAGEWGHNPLPWPQDSELPGAECYCGKHGCIETWLSGPGMVRDHELHNNVFLDAETIDNKARFGDEEADETLERYENRMARSLAHVINILDPDVIVLGGGMGNIKRLYKNVPMIWGDYIFSDVVNTKLVSPVHGDSSGVRGAAWLWNR
ncbi:MAG: ROK family protein [Gammaproteobacteria bacterium]|nr:ROK family protein [Gammaproteobacteria bacterium]NNJ49595.1 ROK family protein [Gammaproteobacteria bacterium]